tara:strand:+ start:628 stop:837 length:210 start_codon:yes stop_codon:yes gene_type:complete
MAQEKVHNNAERIARLEATVENIRDNHLKHMSEDIDRIEKKVDTIDKRIWYVLILLVGSTILGMIGEYL